MACACGDEIINALEAIKRRFGFEDIFKICHINRHISNRSVYFFFFEPLLLRFIDLEIYCFML